MIALWVQGKYVDTWFNTMDDTDFMEVTMINLGLNPDACEWIEYEGNPNGHSPRQINDADKSFKWIMGEIIPQIQVESASEIGELVFKFNANKVYLLLDRILQKQTLTLKLNLLETQPIPEIPTEYTATLTYENKVVMKDLKTIMPKEVIIVGGQRKKLYTDEKELPPKFENLTAMAKFLRTRNTKWSDEFKQKLSFYGDMK